MNLPEYNEKVLEYLEYIGYPEYVIEYEPEDVARSIVSTSEKFYILGVSHRSCAIVIFALTMKYKRSSLGEIKMRDEMIKIEIDLNELTEEQYEDILNYAAENDLSLKDAVERLFLSAAMRLIINPNEEGN